MLNRAKWIIDDEQVNVDKVSVSLIWLALNETTTDNNVLRNLQNQSVDHAALLLKQILWCLRH